MSEKDSETFAGMDAAAKAVKEKLEAAFAKDDPDEASPEDRTARPQVIGDIAYELAFGGEEAMREPKGPFDTSLTVLRYGIGDGEDFEAAIRVLKAAGKVDKGKALDGMEAMRAMMSRELFMNTGLTFQAIYTLLEALPEKEEKK